MNFTELQMELRSIEEHISQLHNEIEKMKPQTEEEKKTDFEAISKLARKHPMKNGRLIKAMTDVKKVFISGLSYLLLTEETGIYERLLYLTRLSIGCDLDMTAEEIYKKGLEFEAEDIEELCKSLTDYKYTYLVESFIIANLSEEAPVNMLSVIADIAKGMECDKEEIRVTAQVAKAKLIDNMDILENLPIPSKNRWSGQLTEYIPYFWLVGQRIQCGRIHTLEFYRPYGETVRERYPCEIVKRQKAGSIVKKGDSVCIYNEKVKKSSTYPGSIWWSKADDQFEEEERILTAPHDGIVFFIEEKVKSKVENKMDEFIVVYVVSYFDEYEDFCKWYRMVANMRERKG